MKKKRKLKRIVWIYIFIVFIILSNLILYKSLFSAKAKLIGTWTTDDVTTYEFYKNNTGKLVVSLSEYKFKYSLKKNILYIDFENDKSEDSKYEYKFINKKLVLSNEKGIFTFVKQEVCYDYKKKIK